ncbi:MAG: hypothetical protein Q8M03_08165 [Legionella sp.]|nr:hypothetical protein [Legionella sp.]
MAFYLFPGVMYHRYKKGMEEFSTLNIGVHKSFSDPALLEYTLDVINQVYELCTRQYLGFGALLQFLPGTNANRAREQLSNTLEPALQSFQSSYSNTPPIINRSIRLKNRGEMEHQFAYREFYWFKKHTLLLSLYSFLNFSPFFKALEDIAKGFKLPKSNINFKLPLIEDAITFPILKDIFFVNGHNKKISIRDNALGNLLHSVLNPVRIIDDTLNFLHVLTYRLIETGSARGNLSWPRAVTKGIAGLFFGVIKLPIKTLKHLIDLPLDAAKLLFISPIAHFASSIRNVYQNWDKEIFIATKEELQAIKELRRTAKGRGNTSFSVITKELGYRKEYVGISKRDVFSEFGTNPKQLVLFRAPKDKNAEESSLFKIVRQYSAQNLVAKNEPDAIAEAKRVLKLS